MKKWIFIVCLFCLTVASAFYSDPLKDVRAASFADISTVVLYDAASGAIPDKSLMPFTAFPSDATSLTYSDGMTVLDTTISGTDTLAGWVSSLATTPGFPTLDPVAGVQFNFSLQIESESHANNRRAGFSVIMLDKDAKGIELAFWENEIWVQSDDKTGGMFKHGEEIAFDTTSLMDYQLTFAGDTYTLTANSEILLSGPLRDYRAFEGFPDPYETPNFIFLGDDTTSSQARIRLRYVSVAGTAPVITIATTLSSSTSTPLPLASPTPLPGATPVPSPTPISRGIELCPSSGLIGIVMIVVAHRRIKRRHGDGF